MNKGDSYKPDWAPEDGGDAFAVSVVKGVEKKAEDSVKKSAPVRSSKLTVDDYVKGILDNKRAVLGRAITLIESNSPTHYKTAREVLKRIAPHSGKSVRVGITGVPGAGKSTMIEALGCYLADMGHKVAVLAVDPSSTVTGGSILGDKTRMEKLSRRPECFIRPSPSGGALGGVTRKSRETTMLCEAAGYDVILVETVGVGQNEVTVRSMVDFFLLVMISGAGDELQGIKKGVIEIADALMVNKADGDNLMRAEAARVEYSLALKYLQPATRGWVTNSHKCSSLTGEGIPELWKMIEKFRELTVKSGEFQKRREDQTIQWVYTMVEDFIRQSFYNNPLVKAKSDGIRGGVLGGSMLPTEAAEDLLKTFYTSKMPDSFL